MSALAAFAGWLMCMLAILGIARIQLDGPESVRGWCIVRVVREWVMVWSARRAVRALERANRKLARRYAGRILG